MCPNKDWFLTYDPVDSNDVHMGNNVQCTIAEIGNIKIKTHNGIFRTLSSVHHILDLKRTLISLGTPEFRG